jgi:uroporphyrin-III C-methyltransferase/precorrin-2 dehydrogenase/sirohydrochlorin ferrochelatase
VRYFPLFVDLRDQLVVVVGGGAVAERKIALLVKSGARIRLVSPVVTSGLQALAVAGAVEHLPVTYAPACIAGARLVVAASSDRVANQGAAADARAAGVLVNVVDDPEPSSCLFPAIVDRTPLVVAIGTAGAAPALAQWVRERVEVAVDESFGRLATLLERWRATIKARVPELDRRRRLYARLLHGTVAAEVAAGRDDVADGALRRELDAPGGGGGRVTLVGAGPGDPGLLTLHAVRALAAADVVLHDRLVSAGVLALARRDATLVDVGKRAGAHATTQARIQQLMVDYARQGHHVVRLKGGDPFVFGRGGEELEWLRAAGIAYSVVPGLTAASAAASYAGIPLTHRDHSATVRLITAHCQDSLESVDWQPRPDGRETLAIYMGIGMLAGITAQLLAHGHASDTPIAFVENGTRPEQRVVLGCLGEAQALAARHAVRAPALLLVGPVTRLAATLHWYGAAPEGAAFPTANARRTAAGAA